MDMNIFRPRYCAFFDVDGTLINTRSLLSFLEYMRGRLIPSNGDFMNYYELLKDKLAKNVSREDVNRFYYTIYKGLSVEDVESMGAQWFAQAERGERFYNERTLSCLARHRAAGARIVLVTGSFLPLMELLACKVGAHAILCSTPEVVDGRFTGKLDGQPCIGAGKASAITRLARHFCIELDKCYAYGDDQTDRPMMELVGNPVWVTPDIESFV